jgi:signal peptidase
MTMARVTLAPTEIEARESGPRSALGWLGQLLAWMVILAVTTMLVVTVGIPRIAGATPYTVLTGSMSPGMPPGTLVVVRPADQIGIGEVVTYQLESGKPAVVTHRVVSVAPGADGKTMFQTQGDANDVPDESWVSEDQIRGVRWYSVPFLGHVNNLLTGKERQMAVYAVAALLLGYAGAMLAGSLRDRRRRPA